MQQPSTQQSVNSCIFHVACQGTQGQESNPLKSLTNALDLKETRVLSLAYGISSPATGAGGEERRGEERKAQGKGERGRQNTLYHNAVSQEMQPCCVCLLTKMSNACFILGNFHICYREQTAVCLKRKELAEGLEMWDFLVFLFFFLSFILLT